MFRQSNIDAIIRQPSTTVELRVDSINLRRANIHIHRDQTQNFVLVGADSGSVPAPCDLVAAVERSQGLHDGDGGGLGLAGYEGLFGCVGWVVELYHHS